MNSLVPIPERMARLERDGRGYPIPVTVYRDSDGRPHFTVNDENCRLKSIFEKRCPICGDKLVPRNYWFVGGPLSALKAEGVFNDPAMHEECAHYALEACPYLAAPNYSKRIDDRTLPDSDPSVLYATRMIMRRPPLFVCAMARDYTLIKTSRTIAPDRPFKRVEYWQNGKRLSRTAGERIAAADLALPMPAHTPPAFVVRPGRRA